MKKTLLLMTASLLLSTPSGFAQKPGGEQKNFTLNDCLQIAATKNLDIQKAQTNLLAASAEITNAFGNFLPNLNFSGGYNRRLNVDGGQTINIGGQVISTPGASPNSYNMNLSSSVTVFDGFARESSYNRAQSNFTATDLSIQQTRRDVLISIRSQFLNILRLQQVVNIRREDLDLGKKQVERARAQFEAGVAAVAVVYSQEAELGGKELALVQAENDLDVAKSSLLTTMGLNPGQSSEFLTTGIPDAVKEEELRAFRDKIGSPGAAVNTALQKRVDYSAADVRLESAKSSVISAKSTNYPSISASGGWGWSNSELNSFDLGRFSVGLNLSYAFFDNFRTNNQSQSAEVQLQQREIEKKQLEQKIVSDVQTAMLTLSAAEKQVEITIRSLKSAEQNFTSASERFKIGAANVLDYNTANAQAVNARINRINAIYNYISAQYQMLNALGTLDN